MTSPSSAFAGAADDELIHAFMQAESRLLTAANEGCGSLERLQHDLNLLVARAKTAIDHKQLHIDSLKTIFAASINIRTVANFYLSAERRAQQSQEKLDFELGVILRDSNNLAHEGDGCMGSKRRGGCSESTLAEATKFKPCRDYFLAHFGAPYPSNDVKNAIAAEIGVKVSSITMWFTNNRRRSGWNDIMRDHVNNNKELMRQLVDDVLNPSETRPIPDDARKAVLDAKAFITRLSGDDISDVFREALAMEPMTPEELKAYSEERRMMQKRLADRKRTREESEAHKARKAARAKAREVKAARKPSPDTTNFASDPSALSAKRKRMDENGVMESGCDDRPTKRSHVRRGGEQDASISTVRKRKRAETWGADANPVVLNNERAAKRVRISDVRHERKPRTRHVLDADGNPRRLRRKPQFRYRRSNNAATPIIAPETRTQADEQRTSVTPLIVKKRKHNRDADCAPSDAPSPRLPTSHKRRRMVAETSPRFTSSIHQSKSPQHTAKSLKKRETGRSASAPTSSRPEVPFLVPNVDEAMRQANRIASGPSDLVGLGAYVEGDAMLPPLTEEQLAMFIQPSESALGPAASGPAVNADQITIDIDPHTFNNISLSSNLNSINLEPAPPLPNPLYSPTDLNGEGIDAFLQMVIPQNQLQILMTGADNLFLDPSLLNVQLSQLQAEQAAQQQLLDTPFDSQPQSVPFLPFPACNSAPQVPGSFEDVLMNALIAPLQPPQPQVLAPGATTFPATASHSLSASSSFSSDFSGTSSFAVPSPNEESADANYLSDSRARSLSPNRGRSTDLYAEVERRKRDLEDHLREYERKRAELGSIVTACAHSVIDSNDLMA